MLLSFHQIKVVNQYLPTIARKTMEQNGHRVNTKLLLDIVYSINRSESAKEYAETVLHLLPAAVACDKISLILFPEDNDGDIAILSSFLDMNQVERQTIAPRCQCQDPVTRGLTAKREASAFRDDDLFTEETILASEIYKKNYLSHELRYAIRIILAHNKKQLGQIVFLNKLSSGNFSNNDLEICRMLSNHLSLKLWSLMVFEGGISPKESFALQHKLSKREFEIASKIADGFTDSEISHALAISESTVRKHIGNLYSKTGTSNRASFLRIFYNELSPQAEASKS